MQALLFYNKINPSICRIPNRRIYYNTSTLNQTINTFNYEAFAGLPIFNSRSNSLQVFSKSS